MEELLSEESSKKKRKIPGREKTEVKNLSDEEFKTLGMLTELGKIID